MKAIDDPAVSVAQTAGPPNAPPVRLDPTVMALITRAAGAVRPGVPVVPVLEVGGTDGFFCRELGIVYGVNSSAMKTSAHTAKTSGSASSSSTKLRSSGTSWHRS